MNNQLKRWAQKYDTTPKMVLFMFGSCSLLVIAICLLIGVNLKQGQYNREYRALNTKVMGARNDLSAKQTAVKQMALVQTANDTSNQVVAFNSKQALALQKYASVSSHLFDVLLTWNNGNDYRERKVKAENYVTKTVLNDKTIFDDGKDVSGGDYVTLSKLHSEYLSSSVSLGALNDQGIADGVVAVTYGAWRGSAQAQMGRATDVYQVTYDSHQHKITHLQKLYTLNRGANDNDSSD